MGDRANRRHKPGRAFERTAYRFDVLADYGAFRDLQRHRMLSIEWQALSPRHGFTRPEAVDLAGATQRFDEAMERSAALHDALVERFPAQAAYAVSWPTRCASTCTSTPGRPCTCSSCARPPRATRPTGWWARRCTG